MLRHIDAHLGMFVFAQAPDAAESQGFALVNADAKSALPWEHYMVLAGRVAGAQLTGIGGCIKRSSGPQQRVLLLLPLACDANGDVATSLQVRSLVLSRMSNCWPLIGLLRVAAGLG